MRQHKQRQVKVHKIYQPIMEIIQYQELQKITKFKTLIIRTT